jgi:hypothetical protein
MPDATLEQSLSRRATKLEKELTEQLMTANLVDSGLGQKKSCQKMAAELMDSLLPKAVVLGHSAGGFSAYTLALNPRRAMEDNDPFRYDAGDGVSMSVVLSAPVGQGMERPAPPAVLDLAFARYDKSVLTPMEQNPFHQTALHNPFYRAGYANLKQMSRLAWRNGLLGMTMINSPLLHAVRPGYEQVMEDSDFFQNHIDDRQLSDDHTAISVSTPQDGIVPPERTLLDETQPNLHNLSVELNFSPDDRKEMVSLPTYAHVKLGRAPRELFEQFQQSVLETRSSFPVCFIRPITTAFATPPSKLSRRK